MPYAIDNEHIHELLAPLSGRYEMNPPDGAIRLITTDLPDAAVAAVLPPLGDGVLRVVYDPSKPDALAHTTEMLRRAWEDNRDLVPLPAGVVDRAKAAVGGY